MRAGPLIRAALAALIIAPALSAAVSLAQQAPPAPTNAVYAVHGQNHVITWDPSPGATHYRVYHTQDETSVCNIAEETACDRLSARVTGTTLTHRDPPSGHARYYVSACAGDAACSPIEPGSHARFLDLRPEPPARATASPAPDGATRLTWQPAHGATHYQVHISPFLNDHCRDPRCQPARARLTSRQATLITPDGHHAWIRACNQAGCSASTRARPAAPAEDEPPAPQEPEATLQLSRSLLATGQTLHVTLTLRNTTPAPIVADLSVRPPHGWSITNALTGAACTQSQCHLTRTLAPGAAAALAAAAVPTAPGRQTLTARVSYTPLHSAEKATLHLTARANVIRAAHSPPPTPAPQSPSPGCGAPAPAAPAGLATILLLATGLLLPAAARRTAKATAHSKNKPDQGAAP